MFDILFDRVKVYFLVELGKSMALFSLFDMTAAWVSRRETMKLIESNNFETLFVHKHRAVKNTHARSPGEMFMNASIFQKLFFEHIYPSYVAYSMSYHFPDIAERRDGKPGGD